MKLALVIVATVASVACSGSPKPPTLEHYSENFETVVASAGIDVYTPYWLGREFSAGGVTFKGPYVSDLPGRVLVGGGVHMSYNGDPAGYLELLVYSPAAWEKDRGRVDASATRYVQVAGQEAKLSAIKGPTRPVEELLLLVKFGDTTVLAVAHAGGAPTPGGPDANPLIDEAALISVMQSIRPYPQ